MIGMLKRLFYEFVAPLLSGSFFTPLSDEKAVKALVRASKYDEATAMAIVAAWRQLANEYGYNGPIAQRVKAGFTLREHAPKVGRCYRNFDYLQDWKLENDEPTWKSPVFFIPCLVAGSKNKNVKEQMALLSDLRRRLNLPTHHLSSFGSAALLAGLILEHLKRTGDYASIQTDLTRTDTLRFGGARLNLGNLWGRDSDLRYGLWCVNWHWLDDSREPRLGCFALGVEPFER